MNISERMRNMVRNWLRIQPADDQTITIRETTGFETNCMRNRIWYRGDASEIEQLFKALGQDTVSAARFWSAVPSTTDVRKAHSGIPAIMVDTLAYLIKSDLNEVKFGNENAGAEEWEEICKDCDFAEIVGAAVSDVLAVGDGAFKISIDPQTSAFPLLEFWAADHVDYIRKHGRITGVVFKSEYCTKKKTYQLNEIYQPQSITYALYDGEKEIDLKTIPELAEYKPIKYDGNFSMAIPLCVFKSPKYPGRGRSIFDNKTDAFDAHDEIISQWIDAVRAGRVTKYIPENMCPRNPKTGEVEAPNSFGSRFMQVKSPVIEGAISQIDTVQPDIKYDAFLQSYTTTLDMCLQGVVSPATLGIDIGKMSSADAQREKKDVTGYTRGAITDALEKVLPRVVSAMLQAYDAMQNRPVRIYEPEVSFGEYAAPDFNSRIETVSKAATSNIMSVEAMVDELWGASKDDDWKEAEIARLKELRGIETVEEPSVGGDLIDVE